MTKWRCAELKSKNISISLVCIHCIEVYFFTGSSICIMHYTGKVFSKCHRSRATSLTKPPSCSAIHMLIRLTKGETKAQIVACMHAPFSSPFCRQRFVSFGVALPICGRIRARAAPGWDRCMWEGWGQNWEWLEQDLKYLSKKESHSLSCGPGLLWGRV